MEKSDNTVTNDLFDLKKKHIDWILWIVLSIFSLIIYIKNPIRYSSKPFLEIFGYKLSYNWLFGKIKYLILILNLLTGLLLMYIEPIFVKFKYWFLIITIISFVVLYEFKSDSIMYDKRNGGFSLPPSYISKNLAFFNISIIIILIYIFASNYKIPINKNFNNIILWATIPINIILNIYLFIKIMGFSSCYYNLPPSWN